MRFLLCSLTLLAGLVAPESSRGDDLRPVPLRSRIDQVQPGTGIVLWSTNEHAATDAIQLEYSYLGYGDVVQERGIYNWSAVEDLLNAAAGRKHQIVLRFYDVYVGKPTTVPEYIKALPDYREVRADSEGKPTSFSDWSHPELQQFVLDFYREFAKKYDNDPRLAYVQAGFGLWAEYHIYDGPMELGRTFPSREYQARFAKHLASLLHRTPWMISVDAADDHTPFAGNAELLGLTFGVFDDSFLCKQHKKENEPNWNTMNRDRWKTAPAGGEFSYYTSRDQELALAKSGPNGVPFETAAAAFHLSFIIGDGQTDFRPLMRIREAGLACGYKFRVTQFASAPGRSRVTVTNTGIAPPYHDMFVAVNGQRAKKSLRGLLPGESRTFDLTAGGASPRLTIESDRLVTGQVIQFDADLK